MLYPPSSRPRSPDPEGFRWIVFLLLFGLSLAAPLEGAPRDTAVVLSRDGQSQTAPTLLGTNAFLLHPKGMPPVLLPLTNLDYLVWTRRGAVMGNRHLGTGTGLVGAYDAGTNTTVSPILRLDPAIDFEANTRPLPLPGIDPDLFHVRWTGLIEAPRSGKYTFHFGTIGGGRFWIHQQGPASIGNSKDYAEAELTLNMVSGQRYLLRAESFRATRGTRAELWWSSSQIPKAIIPTQWLHPRGPTSSNVVQVSSRQGLFATWYADPAFQGKSRTRLDSGIDAHWTTQLPPTMPALRDTWLTRQEHWNDELQVIEDFQIEHQLPGAPRTKESPEIPPFEERLAAAQKRVQELRPPSQAAKIKWIEIEKAHRGKQALNNVTPADTQTLEKAQADNALAESNLSKAQKALKALRQFQLEGKRRENKARELGRLTTIALDQYRRSSIALNKDILPGIPINFFSVRWSGMLKPHDTEEHSFHIRTDEGLRFWLDDELIVDDWWQTNVTERTVTRHLDADRPISFRFETKNTDAKGTAILEWSTPSLAREPIPVTQFTPGRPPAVTAEPRPLISPDYPAGLVLRNGTVLSAGIEEVDADRVRMGGILKRWPVPISNVSRLHFQPLTQTQLDQVAQADAGALLVNGDYVQGDLVRLKEGKATLSSVLFGLRRLDVKQDVLAIVLHESDVPLPSMVVRTLDGSSIYTDQITTLPNTLRVPDFPALTLSGQDLWQIQWLNSAANDSH